jgi:hypothetical protein
MGSSNKEHFWTQPADEVLLSLVQRHRWEVLIVKLEDDWLDKFASPSASKVLETRVTGLFHFCPEQLSALPKDERARVLHVLLQDGFSSSNALIDLSLKCHLLC